MAEWRKVSAAVVAASLLTSGVAHSALHDRGGGLLYDDVLDVTWLQDGNYALTSGYDVHNGGKMSWSDAGLWAANLVYHDSVRNVDYGDWRLASNTPVAGGTEWNVSYSTDGSTDTGFNITSLRSELSYMYYVNLSRKGYYTPSGAYQPDWGLMGNGTEVPQADVGLVRNLQGHAYWSGAEYPPDVHADAGWTFYTWFGFQDSGPKALELHAWAVRPGDVAAVPEPETYAMLLAGLGLLAVLAHRKNQDSRHSDS